MKVSQEERNENTRYLYRSKTEPISSSGMFDGGFKDDSYYRSVLEESQKTEQELFYDEEMEEEDDETR